MTKTTHDPYPLERLVNGAAAALVGAVLYAASALGAALERRA